jgi:hypothetical protein
VLKTYGAAPYGAELKKLEKEIKDKQQTINEKIGVKVTSLSRHAMPAHQLTLSRNQTLVSPLHISGTSPPIANGCKKSSPSKSHGAPR